MPKAYFRPVHRRTAAAAAFRSLVFRASPADGARRIQVREVLAVLERARCRRAYAAYQFADMVRLDAALASDGFKALVADFDAAWRTASRARATGSKWWRSGASPRRRGPSLDSRSRGNGRQAESSPPPATDRKSTR